MEARVGVDEEALFETVWNHIMDLAKEVVKSHDHLGFDLISKKINPSLEDIVASLRAVGTLLKALAPTDGSDPSLVRRMLNAQQQIFWVERAAHALKWHDQDDYHLAIECLRNQSTF